MNIFERLDMAFIEQGLPMDPIAEEFMRLINEVEETQPQINTQKFLSSWGKLLEDNPEMAFEKAVPHLMKSFGKAKGTNDLPKLQKLYNTLLQTALTRVEMDDKLTKPFSKFLKETDALAISSPDYKELKEKFPMVAEKPGQESEQDLDLAPEEPTAEEPTAEEPTAEEPTAEEPTAEEPTAEEPTAEEPTAEEPIKTRGASLRKQLANLRAAGVNITPEQEENFMSTQETVGPKTTPGEATAEQESGAELTDAEKMRAALGSDLEKFGQQVGGAGTPPAGTPPAGTPPAGTPPAGTPPAGTPPAGTPPAGTRDEKELRAAGAKTIKILRQTGDTVLATVNGKDATGKPQTRYVTVKKDEIGGDLSPESIWSHLRGKAQDYRDRKSELEKRVAENPEDNDTKAMLQNLTQEHNKYYAADIRRGMKNYETQSRTQRPENFVGYLKQQWGESPREMAINAYQRIPTAKQLDPNGQVLNILSDLSDQDVAKLQNIYKTDISPKHLATTLDTMRKEFNPMESKFNPYDNLLLEKGWGGRMLSSLGQTIKGAAKGLQKTFTRDDVALARNFIINQNIVQSMLQDQSKNQLIPKLNKAGINVKPQLGNTKEGLQKTSPETALEPGETSNASENETATPIDNTTMGIIKALQIGDKAPKAIQSLLGERGAEGQMKGRKTPFNRRMVGLFGQIQNDAIKTAEDLEKLGGQNALLRLYNAVDKMGYLNPVASKTSETVKPTVAGKEPSDEDFARAVTGKTTKPESTPRSQTETGAFEPVEPAKMTQQELLDSALGGRPGEKGVPRPATLTQLQQTTQRARNVRGREWSAAAKGTPQPTGTQKLEPFMPPGDTPTDDPKRDPFASGEHTPLKYRTKKESYARAMISNPLLEEIRIKANDLAHLVLNTYVKRCNELNRTSITSMYDDKRQKLFSESLNKTLSACQAYDHLLRENKLGKLINCSPDDDLFGTLVNLVYQTSSPLTESKKLEDFYFNPILMVESYRRNYIGNKERGTLRPLSKII